jgi:hypothetical protein
MVNKHIYNMYDQYSITPQNTKVNKDGHSFRKVLNGTFKT